MSEPQDMPPRWGGGPAEDQRGILYPWSSPLVLPARPWGVGITLAWMLGLAAAFLAAGFASVLTFAVYKSATGERLTPELLASLALDGDCLTFSVFLQALFCGAVLFLAVALCRGYPAGEYLALKKARVGQYLLWFALLAVYNTVNETIVHVYQSPTPEWMIKVYESAGYPVLLWLAINVIAPMMEEAVFRGFLFKGIQARLGAAWAVVFAVLPWTALHIQYEHPYYLVVILGLGLLFALARWHTDSLLVPVVMHILNNTAASIQMEWMG